MGGSTLRYQSTNHYYNMITPTSKVNYNAFNLFGDISAEYVGTERNPYDEGGESVVLYNYGRYELRTNESGVLFQVGLRQDETPNYSDVKLLVTELRTKAIEIIGTQIEGFNKILSSLHTLEANDRREVYYFRWEDLSEPLSEDRLPPFVQIGLFPDGSISSYTNTLTS